MNLYLEKCPWIDHYLEINFKNNHYLTFTKDFMDKNLPKEWEYKGTDNEELQVELVLRKNPSVVFLDTMHVFYEDRGYQLKDSYILKPYMYSEHYCSCNRLLGAERGGYIAKEEHYEEERGYCGEIIFDIKKIYCKNIPNLILYSETMSLDELENSLMSI
ncbi:MAG: hypothetical protein EKK64_10245 [Neisseriaceae bacterium]|nr:MAG: hypothetical protein EKK64_10245 [Neisseriaceae bacterium]